jgi:hypothetical protein
MNTNQLKTRLQQIKEHNIVPEDILDLSKAMIEHIGTTDAELRDQLIYSLLAKWIVERRIEERQLKIMLSTCIEDHLLKGIEERQGDFVFARSFSILIITAILYYHNSIRPFLTTEEVLRVKGEVLRYARLEKDRRGYVPDRGWAHATAHCADCLNQLAVNQELTTSDLQAILDIIASHVQIREKLYDAGEDERLVTPVLSILERGRIAEEAFVEWLHSFAAFELHNMWPQDYWLVINLKTFLRSLYFRTQQHERHQWIQQEIERVLQQIKERFPEY